MPSMSHLVQRVCIYARHGKHAIVALFVLKCVDACTLAVVIVGKLRKVQGLVQKSKTGSGERVPELAGPRGVCALEA